MTAGLLTSPASCLGSEPPERAMVKRPFFSTDSFCALMMNWARASTNSAPDGNAQSTGGLGVVLTIAAGGAGKEWGACEGESGRQERDRER